MSAPTDYQDYWVNPRIKIAALWASMMFVFVCGDVFSLYRGDVRADLEAGKISVFSIGQGYLLGVTLYVMLPSLLVFLSLVMPVRITRVVNIVTAVLYAITVAGSAVGEWSYFILASLTEAALLVGVAYYAWTWPRTEAAAATPSDHPAAGARVPSTTSTRGYREHE